MTVKFSPWGNQQFLDENGDPAVGWKVYSYVAGSSTAQSTYTTSAGSVAQTNPIILNTLGFPTTGQIWLTDGQTYKLVLTDENDVVQKTEDNISGVNDTGSTTSQWPSSGVTPTYVSATSYTVAGDQTAEFHAGRRQQFTVTAGTVYGKILSSTYGALTTVTMSMDTGQSLDSGLSAVNHSILRADRLALPTNIGTPGFSMLNGTLSASVSSSALTIAIKTLAGADPSAGDPVYVLFRNVTAGTGDFTYLTISAATSIVVSSGSTLGTTNATAHRLWVVGFNDAGTFRMGVVNALTSSGILPMPDYAAYSSTAEGGAGAADTAGVIYTGTAVTSKSLRILGFVESTQATAGTWATTPSRVHLASRDTPMPGQVVQFQYSQTGAVASGTTTIPNDDTIPQNTEGDQYLSLSITPTSAINRLAISSLLVANNPGGVENCGMALFQDSTAGALAAIQSASISGGAGIHEMVLRHEMAAGTTSSTTMKIRAGNTGGSSFTINGVSTARKYGGVMSSWIRVEEIMV
jgi:hypothetical protein